MNSFLLSIILLGTPLPATQPNITTISFPAQKIEVYSEEKIKKTIEKFSIIYDVSPEEMFAIAYIESRFNPEAISRTGDYGLFQINCAIWWETLNYSSVEHCKEVQTTYYPSSVLDAIFIVKYYRSRYSHCAGQRVFSCYNGGNGWRSSPYRERAKHYGKRVKKTYEKFITKH